MNDRQLLEAGKAYLLQYSELYGKELLLDVAPSFEKNKTYESLSDLRAGWADCRNCALSEARTQVVTSTGDENAEVICIVAQPGADDDRTGMPLSGKDGELFDKILAAINLSRKDVYLTSLVKCRPAADRKAKAEEFEACNRYFTQELGVARPRFMLVLGEVAGQTILGVSSPLPVMRAKVYDWNGVKVVVTHHPRSLHGRKDLKKETWHDVQLLRDLYLT